MIKKPTFYYSIILSDLIPEKDQLLLFSHLTEAKLSYEINSKLSPKKVLLISISDYKVFLQETDNLNFEKAKTSKRTLSREYIETLKHDKYYYFLKHRENLDPVIQKLETSSCFKFRIRHKFLQPGADINDYENIVRTLFEPQEIIRTIHWMLHKMEIEGEDHKADNLIESFILKKYINDIFPLHDYEEEHHKANYYNDGYIKSYFGEHIAIYFKFLTYLQFWLLAPVILGLFIFFQNYFQTQSIATYESFYSIFIIIWGNLFLVFWEKKEHQIAFTWKCFGKSFETQETLQNSNEAFNERINDVSGLKENYYPTMKRIPRYIISAILSIPILVVTFIVLMLSLNLRGFVIPEYRHIYVKFFSDLAQPGEIFDKNTSKILLPTILHVVLVSILSKFYKNVSEWTSKHEFHKTYLDYENSLIVKRFFFEMFNTFTDFIYIGFIRLDIEGLKKVLLALFMVDEFRRVIIETVIPLIKLKLKEGKSSSKAKTEDFNENDIEEYREKKIMELGFNHYDSFDDYLEVIINFGYVTLFASATPLAPLFIYLFHLIEGYSDRYKIFNLYRRPLPTRARDIGSWKAVMRIMALLSVVTNIFLFSFSSNKIIGLFGYEHMENMSKYIVIIVFVSEHLLFVFIWVTRKIFLSQKDWTNVYWERKSYKQKIRKLKEGNLGKSEIERRKE